MRTSLKRVRCGLILTFLLSIPSAFAEQTETDLQSQTLNLEKCFVDGISSQVMCGQMAVAENRAKPMTDTNKVDLNVVVLPKFKEESKEFPVVFLAGGPGQAATELAGMMNSMLGDIRQHHDIILVDQRGTGKSSPLLCEEPNYDPLSYDDSELDIAEEVAKCLKNFDDRHLASYNSIDSIKDVEAVREALGYEKVHVMGGSYGTRAGFTYLQQFPESVATATLDSNAPMQLVIGFFGKTSERAFELLLEDCAVHEDCRQAFPELKQDYLSLMGRLKNAPIKQQIYHPHSGKPVEMVLTFEKVSESFRSTLYGLPNRTLLPYAISSAANGDYRMLAAMIGSVSETERSPGQLYGGLTLNILCNEDFPRAQPSLYEDDADNYFNGDHGYKAIEQFCKYWPRWDVEPGFNEPLKTDVPVLLFSGKYDPVTPPEYGDMAMETLSNAKHVVIQHGSHTASYRLCSAPVSEFLKSGKFDELDFSCAEKTRPHLFLIDKNQIK